MKRVFVKIWPLFLVIMCLDCSFSGKIIPTIDDIEIFPRPMDKDLIRDDEQDNTWMLFISDHYGFREFWLAHAVEDSFFLRPTYTGVPAIVSSRYHWSMDNNHLSIRRAKSIVNPFVRNYIRQTHIEQKDSCLLSFSRLTEDIDMDGLTDLAEYVLWTDPEYNDTDGDGKADGFDQNPLAAPAQKYKIHERLHKFIIEEVLKFFHSTRLVIVEQINEKPMEYERKKGLVLSLSTADADTFVNWYGYGVPILTTTIKDTLRKYKVSFQFFIAPDDAWGYDALYDWDLKKERWIRKRTYDQWMAEEKP